MWLFRRRVPRAPEATAARIRAEREFRKTQAATPAYVAIAESMRELHERNNFAAAIETSFRGGRP